MERNAGRLCLEPPHPENARNHLRRREALLPFCLRLEHLLGIWWGEYLVGRGVPRKSTGVRGPGQVSLSPHPPPKPGSRSVSGPPSLLLGCRALEVTGAEAQMAPPPPGVSLPARESEGTGRSS